MKRIKRACALFYAMIIGSSMFSAMNVYARTNDVNVGRLPAMGWCSWNLYLQNVNTAKIHAQADAMVSSGLSSKGYSYIIVDDGCLQATRSPNGLLQAQTNKFPEGFTALGDYIHSKGLKFGMYNAAGTKTCAQLAGSYNFEYQDAQTFADWGVDYLKYDFCNNPLVNLPVVDLAGDYFKTSFESTVLKQMAKEAPPVRKITIKRVRNNVVTEIKTIEVNTDTTAVSNGAVIDNGFGMSTPCLGMLDSNSDFTTKGIGTLTFTLSADEMDAQSKYLIDVYCINPDKERLLSVKVNSDTATFPNFYIKSAVTPSWNAGDAKARTIQNVPLVEGVNTVQFYLNKADCLEAYREDTARSQKAMADALDKTNRSILFNICEWGWSQPYTGWASKVGQSWRTTTDIISSAGSATWNNEAYGRSIVQIYEKNVLLDAAAGPYGYNDPDVLCVGLSGLNFEQNKSHFSLWCMMAAPLLLGTDLTSLSPQVLDIIGNEQAIAIDQDALCLQGKRFKQEVNGQVDYIVKPLADGSVALCIFNKSTTPQNEAVTLQEIAAAASAKVTAKGSEHLTNEQIALFTSTFANSTSFSVNEIWYSNVQSFASDQALSSSIPGYGVHLYKISPIAN